MILDFIYPPVCLHCEEMGKAILCDECLALMQPIDPQHRCRHCFEELTECHCVKTQQSAIFAAVFDDVGPASLLSQEMISTFSPALIKTISSYLIYQLHRLSWEPDAITFFPFSFTEKVRAHNPSLEIAKKMSQILRLPLKKLLKIKHTALFVTELELRKENFTEQNILLITLDDNKRYKAAYEVLMEGFPKKLYHLSFVI